MHPVLKLHVAPPCYECNTGDAYGANQALHSKEETSAFYHGCWPARFGPHTTTSVSARSLSRVAHPETFMEFPKLGLKFVDDKDFERTRTPPFEVFLGLGRHLSRRFAMRAMASSSKT